MTGLHVAHAERAGLPGRRGFVHECLIHATQEEMLAVVVPFVREGLDGGDAVALACSRETGDALADLIGDPRVIVLSRRYPIPRIPDALAALRDAVRDVGGRRLRAVGGLDYGAAVSGWTDWCRLESLLNRELAPYPLWLVCTLDSSALPPHVLDVVGRAHPAARSADGAVAPNPAYLDTPALMSVLAPGVPDPLQAEAAVFALAGLDDLRAIGQVRDRLRASLPPAAGDFVACVSEVVTNALMHGLPPVDVTLWTGDGRAVCTVRDRGEGLADPTAGYSARHLSEDPQARLGLHVVHRLCDRVDHELTPDGFVVRLTSNC